MKNVSRIISSWFAHIFNYRHCFRLICWVILFTFSSTVIGEDLARAWSIAEPQNIIMPLPGTLMPASPVFSLPTLKAIAIDPQDPFNLDFVVDTTDQGQAQERDQGQINLLVRYFLSFLTIPEEDLWVNLSPYEKDRIITPQFEITNAGRDMLLQDYILKQLASSLTHPDSDLGKIFWKRVFERAKVEYGGTNIPVNTFNKVWVVPDKAIVYEDNGSAFISESRLKVLVEEDYLSIKKNEGELKGLSSNKQKSNPLSSEITREIIIPELEREVNEGKYFAPLRQMYSALILAIWFKKRLKENVINRVYVNQKKTFGIALEETQIKEKIYQQYLQALKKGAYNFIREDYDEASQEIVPRKYFSGGFSFADAAGAVSIRPASRIAEVRTTLLGVLKKGWHRFTMTLKPVGKGMSKKALMSLAAGTLVFLGGIQQADAQNTSFLSSSRPMIQNIQINNQPLRSLQVALNKIDGNTSSILGNHPGALGYQRLKAVVDAIDGLPATTQIQPQATQLRQAILDPTFFDDNIAQRNKEFNGPNKGFNSIRTNSQAQDRVATGIKELKRVLFQQITVKPTFVIPKPVVQNQVVSQPVEQKSVFSQPVVQKEVIPKNVNNTRVEHPIAGGAFPKTVTPPANNTALSSNRLSSETISRPVTAVEYLAANPQAVPSEAQPNKMKEQSQVQRTADSGIVKANAGGYDISYTVNPVPVEDKVMSRSEGIVLGLDAQKKEYKKGELILTLQNLELNARIDALSSALEIRKNKVNDLKALFEQQAASYQELVIAQEEVDDLSHKLAKAYQEREVYAVRAPHDLIIKEMLVVNGMNVSKGAELLKYFDQQRVRINIIVPSTVSSFNRIANMTLNAAPIHSVMSVDWSLDPLQRNAQVGLVVNLSSPIPSGRELSFRAHLLPPEKYDVDLDSITGITQSIASVREAKEYIVRSPADGEVKFLVREGQKVQSGQVVAVVNHKFYLEEAKSIELAIRGIDVELANTNDADGNLVLSRFQLDGLKIHRASLLARLKNLQSIIERLNIRAPTSGVVSQISSYTSTAFENQDELLRLRTGFALVGGVEPSKKPILFPQTINIASEDPVLVRAPNGVSFAAKVTAVNKKPQSSIIDLNGFQTLEVIAHDPQGILQPNLPVSIVIPKNEVERQLIKDAFRIGELPLAQSQNAGNKLVFFDNFQFSLPKNTPDSALKIRSSNIGNSYDSTGINAKSTLFQSLDLQSVDALVRVNRLITGALTIELQQKKLEENVPKASRVSITGAVYAKDGKIYYSGGLMGALRGIAGGSLQSGSAIGVAAPVVFGIAGNVMDWFTGRVGKEIELAKLTTTVTYHHIQTELDRQIYEAQRILIDLGAVQEKSEQLKALLRELENAKSLVIARESTGFSLKTERDQIQSFIDEMSAQLLALQGKQKTLTVALNAFVGPSNNDFHQTRSATLPFGKKFLSIDEIRERQMAAQLIGSQSPDARMKKALALFQEAGKSLSLQGLQGIPTLTATTVVLDDARGFNPTANFLPGGEGLLRTSRISEGGNAGIRVDIPLLNQEVRIKTAVMELELEKARLHVEKTAAELTQELAEAASHIRNLSSQIEQAEASYKNARHVLELKLKRPDIYLSDKLVGDRIEIVKLEQRLIDLKVQYLKGEASLRRMKVIGPETSIQKLAPVVLDTFQAQIPRTLTRTWPSVFSADRVLQPQPLLADSVLAAGVIYYQGFDATSAWALMRGDLSGAGADPLKTMKRILVDDPNIFVRADALQHFLAEYRNNKDFIPALKEIALDSPYQDVVGGIFKFMKPREDKGLPLMVTILNEALTQKKDRVLNLGFSFLGDILMMHPESVVHLSQSGISREMADKVFLAFLFREGEGSIAKERFLKGDFWSTDDLARIHQSLMGYSKEFPGAADQVGKLASLIYDEMLRKEALANIDEVFRPGSFEHLGVFGLIMDQDIVSYIKIIENAKQNRAFLITSPNWRDMQHYIHPQLYAKAKGEVNELLLGMPLGSLRLSFNDLLTVQERQEGQQDELEYIKRLGLEAQRKHITTSSDIPELARMLGLQTPLRDLIIDRLMLSVQGRVLVLKTYIQIADSKLLQLIESRRWTEALKGDLRIFDDAANNHILRLALTRMYERTGEESFLNLSLMSYSNPELHTLNDPRGAQIRDAKIDLAALKIALTVLDEKMKYRPVLWAGYALQSPGEALERVNLQRMMDQETDPRKVKEYVDNRNGSVKNVNIKSMLEDVISYRHSLAQDIKANDQIIQKLPTSFRAIFMAVGIIPVAFFVKRLRHKLWMRGASEKDLTGELYQKLLDNEQGGFAENGVIPPPNRVFNSTGDIFNNWHALISRWNAQESISAEIILNDFNTILNYAEEVLNDMPYTPDLMWHEGKEPPRNDMYQRTFSYFNLLAINTLSILKKRLQVDGLSELQRSKLEDDIGVLLDNINYGNRFSRILSYRGNVEKVMSYKFPNEHWTEKTGLYPLIRTILLYQYLWKKSEGDLKRELAVLLQEGNSLIDGFYDKPLEIVENSIRLLKTVTDGGRTAYDPISRDDRIKFRMRSFYSRSLSLLGLGSTIATGVCLALGFPGVVVGGLSLMSFFMLGFSYVAYWHPHLDILRMQWNVEMNFMVDKIKKELELMKLFNPSKVNKEPHKDQDAEVVLLARQEGLEQVRRELDLSHKPNVDMIVIVPQDPESVVALEQYVADKRGSLLRADVPAIVMTSRYQGSGNVYLDVLQQIKRKYDSEDFKKIYPGIRKWDEMRVMFVFHGQDLSRDESIQSAFLDWGITNGYRAARNGSLSSSKDHKSGHILIYSRDAYFGPIPESPDAGITMLTSRVNMSALRDGSLVNMRFTSTGEREVVELLEGVDINSLQKAESSMPRRGKLLNYLRDHFNLSKPSLNQFPVFNGILLIGQDAVRVFTSTAEYVDTRNLWDRLRLSLSSDLLVPMIMGIFYDEEQRKTEVAEYAQKRVRWKDEVGGSKNPVGARPNWFTNVNEVQEFYAFLNETCGKLIKFKAFLPYSRSEVFVRIAGSDALDQAVRLKQMIDQANDSPSMASPGGIDWTNIKDTVQFKENDNAFSTNLSLESFQGFEFEITQYQPILNPVELFLGSSVDKGGSWFANKSFI